VIKTDSTIWFWNCSSERKFTL